MCAAARLGGKPLLSAPNKGLHAASESPPPSSPSVTVALLCFCSLATLRYHDECLISRQPAGPRRRAGRRDGTGRSLESDQKGRFNKTL